MAEVSAQDILVDVQDLGEASIELVAWHRACDVEELSVGWAELLAAGMLLPAGTDLHTGEDLYRTAPP